MQTPTTKDSIAKNIDLNSKTGKNFQKKSEAVADDFRNFVTDTEALLKATSQLGGEELTIARTKLNERLMQARQSLAEMGATLSEHASKTTDTANNYVYEKPWQAIGIGAAAGFIAGYLLNRH